MEHYDVIVAGGGTSGAVAAITAARHGLNTLIIESLGCLGGTQTGALVTPMMDILVEGKNKISGVNEEIIHRLEEEGEGSNLKFNPEALKYVLEEMFLEANGTIKYFTNVVDVIKDNEEIKAIKIFNKEGLSEISSKVYIDCTGDADLAHYSEIPIESGNSKTGLNQPMSFRFEVGNINLNEFSEYLKNLGQEDCLEIDDLYGACTSDNEWPLTPIFNKGYENGYLVKDDLEYFQFFSIPGKPNALSFNCPEIFNNVDGTKVRDLTLATIEGRRRIKRLMKFMKTYFKGFENAYVITTASIVGIRESRRIIGDYILTKEDVAGKKKFNDSIAKCNYYMDVHGLSDSEREKLELLQKNKNIDKNYFEIPYRCCYSNKVKNLLVAGRCISVDFEAQSAMRIQSVCRAIGEACGHAAFLAITNDAFPSEIDGMSIKDLMNQFGADN